jgi:hypothetical protein
MQVYQGRGDLLGEDDRLVTLGRADLASEALCDALKATTSLRRRGSILIDLAALGVQARDLDQVLDYGGQAADLTPWEDTPDWERQAAGAVYRQVSDFVAVSGGATTRLTREQKGRFVAAEIAFLIYQPWRVSRVSLR